MHASLHSKIAISSSPGQASERTTSDNYGSTVFLCFISRIVVRYVLMTLGPLLVLDLAVHGLQELEIKMNWMRDNDDAVGEMRRSLGT